MNRFLKIDNRAFYLICTILLSGNHAYSSPNIRSEIRQLNALATPNYLLLKTDASKEQIRVDQGCIVWIYSYQIMGLFQSSGQSAVANRYHLNVSNMDIEIKSPINKDFAYVVFRKTAESHSVLFFSLHSKKSIETSAALFSIDKSQVSHAMKLMELIQQKCKGFTGGNYD